MRALVAAALEDKISAAQVEPLRIHTRELHGRCGLEIALADAPSLEAIIACAARERPDLLLAFPMWRESPQAVTHAFARIRAGSAAMRIVLVDPFAQVNTRFFGALPHVDALLKRQRLRDASLYRRRFDGGSMFTEFLSRRMGIRMEGWEVDSELPPGLEHRIETGWNLGATEKFRRWLRGSWWSRRVPRRKDIDVFCRMSLGSREKQEWYCAYRMAAVERVRELNGRFNVVAEGRFTGDLYPERLYNRDLARSRIVVSPFGWGEICWRDFEAVCSGALLVKPDVSHIATEPDLFVAGETYVPVQWDFADLAEVCERSLDHPREMARIVANARRAYEAHFAEHRFVDRIGRLMG